MIPLGSVLHVLDCRGPMSQLSRNSLELPLGWATNIVLFHPRSPPLVSQSGAATEGDGGPVLDVFLFSEPQSAKTSPDMCSWPKSVRPDMGV